MRHQRAVVKFLNFFFELEQYKNEFTEKEMDLMRCSGLIHDCMKSGTQTEFTKSKFTKFNHPILMAEMVRNYKDKISYMSNDDLEFIAHCIESHMGQWNTDKKSTNVLKKPEDKYQKIIHLADYLASRKDLVFESLMDEMNGKTTPTSTSAETYDTFVLGFGKHSGEKLIDVWKTDKAYCRWMKENLKRKDILKFLEEIEKKG